MKSWALWFVFLSIVVTGCSSAPTASSTTTGVPRPEPTTTTLPSAPTPTSTRPATGTTLPIPATSPTFQSKGAAPGRELATRIPADHNRYFYGMSADGSMLAYVIDETTACPTFDVREASGTIATIAGSGPPDMCPVSTDSARITNDYIVALLAPPSDIAMTTWILLAINRHSGARWVIAHSEPTEPAQPKFVVAFDGRTVVWSVYGAFQVTSPDQVTMYAADVMTHSVTTIGTGLTKPEIFDGVIFANEFTSSTTIGSIVSIDLATRAKTVLAPNADAGLIAVSDEALIATRPDGAIVMDHRGNPLGQIHGTLRWPTGGGHYLFWHDDDSQNGRIMIMDTRCLAVYELQPPNDQGTRAYTDGTRITWNARIDQTKPAYGDNVAFNVLSAEQLHLCGPAS